MHKSIKMVVLVLLVVLSFQQLAFASSEVQRPPKPTEGIESTNPNFGSSRDSETFSPQLTSLITDWSCTISNTGSDLYLVGSHTASYIVDQLRLTLYLQRWDGSQWVDIKSWTFYEYDISGIIKDAVENYQHGYYYRTRAVHYAKMDTETDTQNSTSAYVYVQ